MDRTTPLIPVTWLAVLLVLGFIALILLGRPRIRNRLTWLFPEACVLYALAVVHLLFFWQPYRSAARVPAGGGDLASFSYPLHAFAAGEIQAGRIPFWSPHQFSGMPHLANFQAGTLYPPNLIAYLLSEPFSYAALERLALLHFLLASYGGYWLGRSLGFGRPVAVMAGVVFAYSGFMVAHLGHYPMLVTAAWAPFVYAALIGTVRRNSWPLAVAGALSLSMAILGGHQPMLLLVLSGAGLVALFELWRSCGFAHPAAWRTRYLSSQILRAALRCVFVLILALGLTLPAWGPALEMTQHTSRGELSYEQASEFSVEPLALIHMVLPTVFGSNPTDFWGPFSSTEIWGYAGIATIVLAGIGVAAGTRRSRLFWAGVGLLGLLYAVGPFTPVHGWLYSFVPAFDRLRGAGRGYFFVDLSLAILAAYGLRALLRYRSRPTPALLTTIRYASWATLSAVGALVVFVIPLFTSKVLGVNDPSNRPMIALDNLMMLTLWLSLVALALLLVRRSAVGGGLAVAMLSVVLVLDLFSVTSRFNPTTGPILAGYEHPELVEFLDARQSEVGPFRIDIRAEAVQPDFARLHGFDAVGGLVDPLALESYEQFSAGTTDEKHLLLELNARYIITPAAQTDPPVSGSTVSLTTSQLLVWELTDTRTRAWFAEDPPKRIAVDADRPGRMVITIPGDSPGGELIVSQVDYPGWTAEIDGSALQINRYRGTLQALAVPAGEHRIELRFEPRYWSIWIAVSIVSGLAIALVLAVTAAPALRRRAPEIFQ